MTVVLFDLDGTVLTFDGVPGPGRTALERATEKLFGVASSTSGLRLAGGTDRALARALLQRVGAEDSEASISSLLDAYLDELSDVLQTRSYHSVGDVPGTVAACRRAGAIAAIATGNTRRGAELKLRSAGLLALWDLDQGGYGCDAEARDEVLRAAVRRCTSVERTVVVVGDTERDVSAARAIGARCVGVAITPRAREELRAAGADAIVDSCGPALVDAIFR